MSHNIIIPNQESHSRLLTIGIHRGRRSHEGSGGHSCYSYYSATNPNGYTDDIAKLTVFCYYPLVSKRTPCMAEIYYNGICQSHAY